MYSNIANSKRACDFWPYTGHFKLATLHLVVLVHKISPPSCIFVPSSCSAVTTVVSLYKTLMMSLDTSYLLLRCLRLFCILVTPYALSPVDFHLCSCLYCITLRVPFCIYLNTTWYFHPGLADCRQACIYASILDH